jgi:hypothetical protein
MARYHLHFTDGFDLVLDRTGTEIPDDESVQRVAFGSALGLMRSLPTYRDWAQWVVAVHDADGFQVDVVPFPDQRVFTELLWQTVLDRGGKSHVPSSQSPHLRV